MTCCNECQAQISDKDHIALNKKLMGRSVQKFLCIDCMGEYLDVPAEELLSKIAEFKEQGCTLFL